MRIRSPRVAACVLFVLVASGVVAEGTAGRDSAADSDPPAYTFAIVYPLVHPFFDPVTEHAIQYAKELGVEVIFRAPEGQNAAQQIEIVEDLIERGVDGIALCATDPNALVDSVNLAMESGVPVIAFESDIPGSSRICFLGTDNYRAGEHLAHVLAREIGDAGDVIICTGLSTQMSLIQRIRGIQDTLAAEYPDVRIIDIRSGEGDPDLTLATIEQQIADHPDFDAFTSIDATGGPVALSIWKARGWNGDRHRIVTFDDMVANLNGIRTGHVAAVVSQKQWTWGPLILRRLLAIAGGQSVQDYLDTGTVEISKENVDSYRE